MDAFDFAIWLIIQRALKLFRILKIVFSLKNLKNSLNLFK